MSFLVAVRRGRFYPFRPRQRVRPRVDHRRGRPTDSTPSDNQRVRPPHALFDSWTERACHPLALRRSAPSFQRGQRPLPPQLGRRRPYRARRGALSGATGRETRRRTRARHVDETRGKGVALRRRASRSGGGARFGSMGENTSRASRESVPPPPSRSRKRRGCDPLGRSGVWSRVTYTRPCYASGDDARA